MQTPRRANQRVSIKVLDNGSELVYLTHRPVTLNREYVQMERDTNQLPSQQNPMAYPPEEGLTWAKNLLRAGRSYSLLEQEKSISRIKGARVAGAGRRSYRVRL